MKDYADVDAYLADSDQWPDEIAAIRPILLSCGLRRDDQVGKALLLHRGRQQRRPSPGVLRSPGTDVLSGRPARGPGTRSSRTGTEHARSETHEVHLDRRHRTARRCHQDLRRRSDPARPRRQRNCRQRPSEALAPELQERLANDDELAEAFNALTPGRQREYNLHISDAKQSDTRNRRIDKATPRILAGKGLRDR